ncbi:MAG: methionine gamma-lyase family protein [Corallococcus sp.]|nr:methionine gamma-lyase family protein [Corallococcus sp.]MCM1359170.1 methionine gamma-lyase family protein [Corallococcus sp.]MCM1394560.1 methionine gamma-lyase family protein [Corallococcus sp.]
MNREIEYALEQTKNKFEQLDATSLFNQKKVLDVFSDCRVALRHFASTNGYGNGDIGRETLNNVVAKIFGTEKALASPLIASGTHALSLSLFGVLRPGDTVLSVCGKPYDTLAGVIYGKNNGSLADFGVKFENIPLLNGKIDYVSLEKYLQDNRRVKMIYLQRSRGYDWRLALKIEQIEEVCRFVRKIVPDAVIFCDNCYGEFVETLEPTQVGVDLCAGSFIKNIGGGLTPTGGYIVGRTKLVDLVAGRLTAPSIGDEIGSYAAGYRLFYQGLFMAPHTVNQAIKTAVLFSQALTNRGYEVSPAPSEHFGDIVCAIKLGDAQKMVSFCQAIQSVSPVDGFVLPEPWEQPGYIDKVIMAAGCFVQGASIELSCDGPIREPYTVYLQGGLTLEHGILALEQVLSKL